MLIRYRDEVLPQAGSGVITVEDVHGQVSVRQLLQARMYQELSEAGQLERQQAQFAAAEVAFAQQQLFVLVDERQAESLEDIVQIAPTTTVTFVRLTPLRGG